MPNAWRCLTGLALILVRLTGVQSEPISRDDRRASSLNNVNNVLIADTEPLGKRDACTGNPTYCVDAGGLCPIGYSCCYSACCAPGYGCYVDGRCYPDVVYTYCLTTLVTYTSTVESDDETVFVTEEYTTTSWTTTTTTSSVDAATTTVWSTVTARKRRHVPEETDSTHPDASKDDPLSPTPYPQYQLGGSDTGWLLRRDFEKLGILNKRTAYVTITAVFTTTVYETEEASGGSTYTSTIYDGTTTVTATTTYTEFDSGGSPETVYATTTMHGSDIDKDQSTDPPVVPSRLNTRSGGITKGELAAVVIGSVLGFALIIGGVWLAWKRQYGDGHAAAKRERRQKALEEAAAREAAERAHREKERQEIEAAVAERQRQREQAMERQRQKEKEEKELRNPGPIDTVKGAKKKQETEALAAIKWPAPYDTPPLGPNEIRVLKLHGGKFSSSIECTLERTNIGPDAQRLVTIPYEALSYAWDQEPDPLFVPDADHTATAQLMVRIRSGTGAAYVSKRIGSNLELALRHLRPTGADEVRTIWTDQLCINQEDDEGEKPGQIDLMRKVYVMATRVIGWLGENDDNVADFLSKCEGFHGIAASVATTQDELARYSGVLLDDNAGAEGRQVLYRVARARFWGRRWILQEVTLPRDIDLQIGSVTIPWKLWNLIMNMCDNRTVHPYDDFAIALDHKAVFDDTTLTIAVRRRIRPVQVLKSLWSQARAQDGQYFMLHLVQALRNWECGYPMDCVYALLGLVDNVSFAQNSAVAAQATIDRTTKNTLAHKKFSSNIKEAYPQFRDKRATNPDVDAEVKVFCAMIEVFGRLVHSVGAVHGLLDGLSHACAPMPLMPSWMNNFQGAKEWYPLTEGVPNDPNHWFLWQPGIFKAAKGTIAKISRSGGDYPAGYLQVEGRLLDRVRFRTKVPFSQSIASDVSVLVENLQIMALAASADIESWHSYWRSHANASDFGEAVRFIAVAGLTILRDPNVKHHRTSREELYREQLPQGSWGTFHDMALKYPGPVFRAQKERRPFLTDHGYIGTGPANMEDGDDICLLHGGQTPYVIRRSDGNEWKYVGECYIHGLMDGEALDWMPQPKTDEFLFS